MQMNWKIQLKKEICMFGIWYRLKVKFWLLAINGATWLLKSIEKRAAKSTGLVGGGTFVTKKKKVKDEIQIHVFRRDEPSPPKGFNGSPGINRKG
jgi:hypothetical protein